jgi:hypothetical protein
MVNLKLTMGIYHSPRGLGGLIAAPLHDLIELCSICQGESAKILSDEKSGNNDGLLPD